jgi:AAA domain
VTGLLELHFAPVQEFAAVDEPGAEPLASTVDGGAIIPSGGIVLVYGSGGAGKTTIVVDLCFAIAAGCSWLGLVDVARPLRVALIENEGPRPEFRRKLRRKIEASGQAARTIVALEEPWGELTLADETHRRGLALALVEHETDLLVLGPLVSAGEFPTGGTPDEIHRFEEHIADLRQLVERPFAILLVHHENRAGQVSGAWERLPDTLVHVTAQGNGRTRVYWQKVRWASSLHGTSTQLLWADGETYSVEKRPEITEDTMAEDLVAAVREHPGASWTQLRDLTNDAGTKRVRGKATELAKVRDRLLKESVLVNVAAREGSFELWASDVPACPRSHVGTGWERATFVPPASEDEPTRSPVPYVSRNGVGNGTDRSEPESVVEDDFDGAEIERLEAIYDAAKAEEAS